MVFILKLIILLFLLKINTEKDWKDEVEQKQFFDEFAQSHSFDPLLVEKWYSIKRRDIIKSVNILIILFPPILIILTVFL